MRKLVALMAALAVAPVIISALVQVQPPPTRGGVPQDPQGRKGGAPQDEAPIRVRNGSLEIETLKGTKWAGETDNWAQDMESAGHPPQLYAQVRYVTGGTCTVRGTTVRIEYGATAAATLQRTGNKIKVKPKNDFTQPDPSGKPQIIKSTAGTYATKVSVGDNSCALDSKEQIGEFFCVAASLNGLQECWDKRVR